MPASFISVNGILYARIPGTELLAENVDVPAVMMLPPSDGLQVRLSPAVVSSLQEITSLPAVSLTASQIGTAATGVNHLAGGAGILGWLSGIFSRLVLPNTLGDNGGLKTAPASAWERLITASDLVRTYSYLNAGDPVNERISTITYTSSSKNLTILETYAYSGSPGSYRLSSITRSIL